jgi:four helix bundle protein
MGEGREGRATKGKREKIAHFRELRVYQMAFDAAMRIFELSKKWPVEERYSLTDQIRRSSRAVCGNIAEAWRKRRYVPHFVSKLSDADSEAAETQAWLDFALRCDYMAKDEHAPLDEKYETISGGLVKMMVEPEKWCGPSALSARAQE